MTSGNNGANTPEDDDPFGYLYADGQANGAQPPSGGYGYPNSVNRVRSVGQRQYGQQAPTAAYGQVPQQQGTYGQPSAHYAAPETLPGGAPSTQQAPAYGGGNGRGRGPNTKGLLIGAIAVVAAVVIGIAVAMAGGDDGKGDKDDQAGSTPTQGEKKDPTPSQDSSADEEEKELPAADAKALRLGGTAALATDIQGAQSSGGVYVGGLNAVGSSVTWTVDGIPEDGAYTVFTRFSVPGKDQSMTLTVNGKEFGSKLSLENYARAPEGDFAKGWTTTYAWPTLNKGTNTIAISCANGDKCDVLLDQLWIKAGQVKE
ncbi:dimeric protein [Streptomyces davaonensis JCM 4913]|uniref:Dimeric protein n=1 Tax=Streptomyces davaonensis (strain DSM 101723 / JCM 4913 / KCC S-0913 / 768) TaxID=1214101 RepID=K4R859_STRDJ|nr:hypothetical protein [Streptomyces davaonensis]CCK29255.1 dimeric protein [Streptomyces davaonensis JCM 4913]